MGTEQPPTFSFWEVSGALTIGLMFIAAGYLSMQYMDALKNTVGSFGIWGMCLYVSIGITATVIAPISATPLIPVAAALWGPFVTSLLNIFAWSIGSVLAFLFARRYGYGIVGKFVRLRRVQQYIEKIPERKLFSTVLLVRLTVPADVLSYALGLFSNMRLGPYTIATLLGVTPFAFILSYTVTLSLPFQILALLAIGAFLFFSYRTFYTSSRMPTATTETSTDNHPHT